MQPKKSKLCVWITIVRATECGADAAADESERKRRTEKYTRNVKIYKLFTDLHIPVRICLSLCEVWLQLSFILKHRLFVATAAGAAALNFEKYRDARATYTQCSLLSFYAKQDFFGYRCVSLCLRTFSLSLPLTLSLFAQFYASLNALRDDDTHLRFHFTYCVTQGTMRSPSDDHLTRMRASTESHARSKYATKTTTTTIALRAGARTHSVDDIPSLR